MFARKHLAFMTLPSINLLLFTDPEHLGAAGWAGALGSRFAIFHGNGFGGLHFFLGAALHAIRLHCVHLLST
jgi:hypothetical protein